MNWYQSISDSTVLKTNTFLFCSCQHWVNWSHFQGCSMFPVHLAAGGISEVRVLWSENTLMGPLHISKDFWIWLDSNMTSESTLLLCRQKLTRQGFSRDDEEIILDPNWHNLSPREMLAPAAKTRPVILVTWASHQWIF